MEDGEEELLTLPECVARLKAVMGPEGPALPTLKRWSATGLLAEAKVDIGRGKVKFRFDEVQHVALKRSADSNSPAARVRRLKTAARGGRDRGSTAEVLILESNDLAALDQILSARMQEMEGRLLEGLQGKLDATLLAPTLEKAVHGALARVTADVTEAIRSVDVIRRMMMVKYDAEVSMLREQIRQMETEKSAGEGAKIELQKITIQLSRALEMLADVRDRLAR